MFAALLNVVLPVVLVAGVGALLARRFPLSQDTLGKVSLNGLTPALALSSLLGTTVSAGAGLHLALAYFALALAGVLLAFLAAYRAPGVTRRAVMASVAIGNNGNFGLPIALFALGQSGLDQAVVIFLCSVVLTFTLGPLLYGSAGGARAGLKSVLRLPVVWCIAAALLVRVLHLPVPLGLRRGIDLLGQAALPMVLLSLGIQLGQAGRIALTWPVLTAVGLRVLAMPALALGLGLLLGLRGLNLQGLVLASAMPTAVNAFLLAREYEADAETVASAVALSTFASLVTAALVVTVLPWVGGLG
ncbi:AEC family transporter [Deinococcus carri]|uniref:AEC family transporter n=1 Tax=Deinococcus carri TaxID=1211323 RepID=UPI0031E5E9B6